MLSTSNDLSATITSNVTDGIVCYNKSIELNCHANDTVNVTTYKWISSTFKQPQETASITVMATDDPVQYTCTVTDANGNIGYSSINISSNGELLPLFYKYMAYALYSRNIYEIEILIWHFAKVQ